MKISKTNKGNIKVVFLPEEANYLAGHLGQMYECDLLEELFNGLLDNGCELDNRYYQMGREAR